MVPADNPAALADALLHLAREPDLRERMGEAARLRLLHGYTRHAPARSPAGGLSVPAGTEGRRAETAGSPWRTSLKRAMAGQAQPAISSASDMDGHALDGDAATAAETDHLRIAHADRHLHLVRQPLDLHAGDFGARPPRRPASCDGGAAGGPIRPVPASAVCRPFARARRWWP